MQLPPTATDQVKTGSPVGDTGAIEDPTHQSERIKPEEETNPQNNIDTFITSLFCGTKDKSWKTADATSVVIKEIEKLKVDFVEYLSESGFDIDHLFEEGRVLWKESQQLVSEMQTCQNKIENESLNEIRTTIENHDKIIMELESVNFLNNIVSDILTCNKHIKDYEDFMIQNNYSGAVKSMTDLLEIVERPGDGFRNMSMYRSIKSKGEIIWNNLLCDLLARWNELLSYSNEVNDNGNTVTLMLELKDNTVTYDIVTALNICKELPIVVNEFSAFLMKEVLGPLVQHNCEIYEKSDGLMLITFKQKDQSKPPFETVIQNLTKLLNFTSAKLSAEYGVVGKLIHLIGNEICSEFRDMVMNECLIGTVPNTIYELQEYETITAQMELFQKFLVSIHFFPPEGLSIMDFLNDLDALFASKTSQYFLDSARNIMLKDLSDTMSIGVEQVPAAAGGAAASDAASASASKDEMEEAMQVFDKVLPQSLFYFPRCLISRSGRELLDLQLTISEHASLCPPAAARRLHATARLIFELYEAVVPYHHEKYLQTIPQYVALFHNNTMYLAHSVQTLDGEWARALRPPPPPLDLAPRLRALAQRHVAQHLQLQRKQMLDSIRASELGSLGAAEALGARAEAALRQCLRQLLLLRHVWLGVLPANVFDRLMSTLVGLLLEELVHRAAAAEDLPAELAAQLAALYSLALDKTPALLQEPSLVSQSAAWSRLSELVLVLRGSLRDIELRWADGGGPLARHYRPDELRGLVKALFQNTLLRANLLSKIK